MSRYRAAELLRRAREADEDHPENAPHRADLDEDGAIVVYPAPWSCDGCGTTDTDLRYDNGDACEPCVLQAFAEAG